MKSWPEDVLRWTEPLLDKIKSDVKDTKSLGSKNGNISKQTRKLRIKQCKSYSSCREWFASIKGLEVNLDVIFSSVPTQKIYAFGVGESVGVTQQQCKDIFSRYGVVERVHFIVMRSFAIIRFSESEAAQKARKELHMKPCQAFSGRMLFIEYALSKYQDDSLSSSASSASSSSTSLQQKDSKDDVEVDLAMENAKSIQEMDPPSPAFWTLQELLKKALNLYPSKSLDSDERIPHGLYLIHDFVSATEEKELTKWMDQGRWVKHSRRHVQHYGYEFDYKINNIHLDRPLDSLETIPALKDVMFRLSNITTKLKEEGEDCPFVPDQLTINRYSPGEGIPPHVDTHSAFYDPIISLSLCSQIVMELEDARISSSSTSNSSSCRRILIPLPARSLLVLSRDARYAWNHSIASRKKDRIDHNVTARQVRISLTFRKVKGFPCTCPWSFSCDSRK